ncbi:MAG: ChrR family anti-sigma-E factor [Rhodobacteraceae bacterium]|nr:ChrR family anti-sigma-E factor [Paracoccaceae bacterium]
MSDRLMYHPADESLLAYAAGTLDEATSVLIATHLSLCPHCRAAVSAAESVGGEYLDRVEPSAAMKVSAADVLAMAEQGGEVARPAAPQACEIVADIADMADMPRPLRNYISDVGIKLKWRWMGPGVRYAQIAGDDASEKIGLLRIAPGTRLPRHGHTDEEYTMVLAGSYESASCRYRRGDVEWADAAVVHQPSAGREQECVCLVVTRGALKATGLFAPIIQPLMAI